MGKLGREIDHLTDAQKDRIVRAQKWGVRALLYRDGRRCLVGHIEDRTPNQHTRWLQSRRLGHEFDARQQWTSLAYRIAQPFDNLCARFGLERIVRACKQRAAATMSSEVETPAPVEVCTADPLNSGYREGV